MIPWLTNPAKLKQYGMLLGDSIIVIMAFAFGLSARALLFGEVPITVTQRMGWLGLILVLLIHLVMFFVFNLYDLGVRFTRVRGFINITCAVTAAVVMSATLLFFAGSFLIGRTVLLTHAPMVIVGAYCWRVFFFNSLLLVKHKQKLALVGLDTSSSNLLADLEGFPVKHYDLVGVLCEDISNPQHRPQDLPVYPCTAKMLPQFVEEKGINTLVYSLKTPLSEGLLHAVLSLRLRGIDVHDFPTFYGMLTGKTPVHAIDTRWVLQVFGRRSHPILHNARRVVEALVASVMLVITTPLFAIIALAIKLDSRGPIFLKQERLGLNQRPFVMYKFRTMVENAEAETGPMWTHAHDPRVTRVGRYLRQMGLDELPQLLNILRGEMAFVGFRPIRKFFADILAKEIPFYHLRFAVRPGITGWPQVRYHYAGSNEGQLEKFQYELFYLQHRSLLLDLLIIVKTIQKALCRRVSDVGSNEPTPRVPENP